MKNKLIKNSLSFMFSFFLSFKLLLILLIFLNNFSFICFADDSFSIIQKIIDTEDEQTLLKIVETYKNSNEENDPLFVGLAYHNLALIDSIKYSNLAVDWLSKYKGKTFYSIALAYRGSAITLVANALSKKGNLIAAASKLDEGFKLMDKAVKEDGNNIIIRFLRAENGIEITETTPFNRAKVVEEDLNFLKEKLFNFSNLQKAQYYLILGRLKLFYKKTKEAVEAFKQVIKEAPDSKYAKTAKKYLSKLED